jgi:amino acid transporter
MDNWSWSAAGSPARVRGEPYGINESSMGTQHHEQSLPRVLGVWISTAIVVGTVIGSGVFLKPRSISQVVPDFNYVALVWIVGGVLTLLGVLALAEVSVLYPRAGGNYVFLREGYGPLAGFLWGWVEFWIIRSASCAALATVFVENLGNVVKQVVAREQEQITFEPWVYPLVTALVILLLALVNMRGARWGGGLQFFVTLVKIGSLIAVMVLPFLLGGLRRSSIEASLYDQPAETAFTWGGLSTAFLGVLWAYHGWMDLGPIAGEVKNPQRNLPVALILGIGIVIVLYVGANVAYHLVLSQREMAGLPEDQNVAAVYCARLVGSVGMMLASVAIVISVFGALNGNLLVGPRLLYAMGQDGTAPRWLGAVHAEYRTPVPAIAVLAGWSILLVLAATWIKLEKKSLFDALTEYAMFGAVIFESLAVTTIYVFRVRYPDVQRPYRCPGYPWTPLISLLVPGFVLVNMFTSQTREAIAGLCFIALGVLVYFLTGIRQRTRALPH